MTCITVYNCYTGSNKGSNNPLYLIKNFMEKTTKKITMATIKSFVKREKQNQNLYIKVESRFDGMTDMVESTGNTGFWKIAPTDFMPDHTLGISGAWFVGRSRDYFTPMADDNFIGYHVSNCCGSFTIAMHR